MRFLPFAFLATLIVLGSSSARGQVICTYEGPNFSSIDAGTAFTTADRITGTATFAAEGDAASTSATFSRFKQRIAVASVFIVWHPKWFHLEWWRTNRLLFYAYWQSSRRDRPRRASSFRLWRRSSDRCHSRNSCTFRLDGFFVR